MLLVEGDQDSRAGSCPHLAEDQPCVVVTIICGKESLTCRLTPSNARLLGASLQRDAEAVDPRWKHWAEENLPYGIESALPE